MQLLFTVLTEQAAKVLSAVMDLKSVTLTVK
jgi:hypothetical protein